MNKKILILLGLALMLFGCQEIKQQSDAMKKEVGGQLEDAYKSAENVKNKAVETKEAIDTKVKEVENAAKAVNEAAKKAEEAKKALEKAAG